MTRPLLAIPLLVGAAMLPGAAAIAGTATLPDGDTAAAGKWMAIAPPPAERVRPDPAPTLAWRPLQPQLSSRFGVRVDPFRHVLAFHDGIDMPAPRGAAVRACADGRVVRAAVTGGYGRLVEIDHGDGLVSLYGHLDGATVTPGMLVRRGELIGRVGSTGRSTGAHLHFEVRRNGAAIDPLPLLGTVTGRAIPAPATAPETIAARGPAPGWREGGGLPEPTVGTP